MSLMTSKDRIFIPGHRGLVGSSIVRALQDQGYGNLILRSRSELDLAESQKVSQFYCEAQPTIVIVAAAKVGGIHANNTYRADFIHENLQIQNNLIWGAHNVGVRRLIFLGSSCIYPHAAPQPMPETCLLTGALEYTNRPYALAKIAGLELVNALRVQYNRDFFSVMPTNLYGPGDNFDPENSHVLPALIRRFSEAVESGNQEVMIWGTGKPRREFLYVDDCADAIVHLAKTLRPEVLEATPQGKLGFFHVNIGAGVDISIEELCGLIAKETGYRGALKFDTSKPDGTPRKVLDVSQLRGFGWEARFDLLEGIQRTVAWFNMNRHSLRGQ